MPVYFDNAATSWPKHPNVLAAITNFIVNDAGNPGRSGHSMSVAAARTVFRAREQVASLLNCRQPERVVFTKNATEALNMIIFGLLDPRCHVITSSMEHNAVMRPLRALEAKGVKLSVVRCDAWGRLDPDEVRRAIRPDTKLILINHASNVSGTIQPIREIGKIARAAGVLFAVDAAQTAGSEPIDMELDCIDYLAFTGHKGLGGPQGTGGLVLGEGADLPPFMHGGTGSLSEQETQPDFLPDKLESGTINAVGLAGLAAAIEAVNAEDNRVRKKRLLSMLIEGFDNIPGVIRYGPPAPECNAGVVSINIRGAVCSEVGLILDQVFGILTRTGLHCAPSAHRTLGSYPQGTVRFSIGHATTENDVRFAIQAVERIVSEYGESDE